MNLTWFDIPSKYIENFCIIVSVTVGIFSKRLTDTSCQDFFLWFFCGISLVMVKTDVKSVFWRVPFSRPGLPFFSFFLFVPFAYYMFLKQKVAHCVLSFWLVCVMLRSYMLMIFHYLWISSQIDGNRCNFVLSLHANTGISPYQKQYELTLSWIFLWGIEPE